MTWAALVLIAGAVVSELWSGLRFEAIWNPFHAAGHGAPFAAVVNSAVARAFLYVGVLMLVASAIAAVA